MIAIALFGQTQSMQTACARCVLRRSARTRPYSRVLCGAVSGRHPAVLTIRQCRSKSALSNAPLSPLHGVGPDCIMLLWSLKDIIARTSAAPQPRRRTAPAAVAGQGVQAQGGRCSYGGRTLTPAWGRCAWMCGVSVARGVRVALRVGFAACECGVLRTGARKCTGLFPY